MGLDSACLSRASGPSILISLSAWAEPPCLNLGTAYGLSGPPATSSKLRAPFVMWSKKPRKEPRAPCAVDGASELSGCSSGDKTAFDPFRVRFCAG